MTGLRIGSIFSGAGALDLAALEVFPGSSIAWHCEKDPAASKVLAWHWPSVPNLGDVTAVDWSAVAPVDVLTAGFPCQDVSAAGKRAGLRTGTRSGLWSYTRDAIEALQPRFVLVENVRGLLSADAVRDVEPEDDDLGDGPGGPVLRALGAVLGDLADLRFHAGWTLLRASDVSCCHQRARVFILAFPADADSTGPQGPQPATRPELFDRGAVAGLAVGAPARLLPTPDANMGNGGRSQTAEQRRAGGHMVSINEAVNSLLPTPRASDGRGGPNPLHRAERMDDVETRVIRLDGQWGPYAEAVGRQERSTRPAPSPVELGIRGNVRLSPAFGEWMMAWPQGWVTDPAIGLSRNEQLRAVGNGVVIPCAVAAYRYLLGVAAASMREAS